MRWGYTFPNSKPVINARSETAAIKPMFKDGMKQRRCLIPATHYYEWEHRGRQSIKYAIRPERSRIEAADGAFVYVDGKWHEPFVFENGNLSQKQTYVIDRTSYEKLYRNNPDFATLIDSGKYIYIGYVVCINDPKYIVADFSHGRAKLKLSDYARKFADECCLKFDYRSTSCLREMQDKYEFYGQSYLSKEVKSDCYVEHTYDKDFNDKCVQTADQIAEAVAAYNAAQDKEKAVRREMASKGCDTFGESLKFHMTRKKIKVEELSERSGLSDTTIKNYRAGTIKYPPIENVMAVCVGLNLYKPYCIDLLGTANYQITNDDPRSRAYRFLLDYTDGTLHQWNMILDEFGLPHIPYQRNQKIAE